MTVLKAIKIKPLDLLIIALLFLASFSTLILFKPVKAGAEAEVRVSGKVVKTFNLKENQEWTYRDKNETNVVKVSKGKIAVTQANCEDHIDVKQGWISKVGQTIVCLPHNLVIEVISDHQKESVDYRL